MTPNPIGTAGMHRRPSSPMASRSTTLRIIRFLSDTITTARKTPYCSTFPGIPRRPSRAVLDIGSGAGHWIEFYRDVFRARQVTGLDTSRSCVAALQEQWADTNNVFVRQADISQPGLGLEEGPFDLISAIGVMFHIVNDQDWERALQTMARHLHPRGTIIVGGHFGWITQNVQFCGTKENPHAYVNKRVRSLSRWRRVAMKCGLTIVGLQRTRSFRGIRTPQNDILFLSLKT